MTQQQMHSLLDVPQRTLRDWKSGNREKLYTLLETLDYDAVQSLLSTHSKERLMQLLENEKYYSDYRGFEKSLYPLLLSHRDTKVWLNFAKDTTLSKTARSRSAYLYSFLTNKVVKLGFKPDMNNKAGFYHGNRNETANALANMYGLKNGIDMQRFNQYKTTGRF